RWNRLYVDVVGTVAFGVNFRDVEIAGGRRTTLPGQLPLTTPGGPLAQPTNSGTVGGDDFAVAPEGGVTFGCQLAEHWRAFFGYNLLYLSRVARPGEAIDLTVNPTQLGGGALAGPARPARTDPVTDFWVQGVTLGVEMRY